jgi:hypothetical protein
MASRIPQETDCSSAPALPACLTPGPLGHNDYADPNFLLLAGDSPGPLGLHDYAEPLCRLRATARAKPGTRIAEGKPATAGGAARTSTSPLVVSQGQITFDAEGNDNPQSPYFSRCIHWPGNAESGVTLGRGYDMGNRTPEQVTQDLVNAGMIVDQARHFAAGAGLKGEAAHRFVTDHRAALGEITHSVQKRLFENIYPQYVARARANYDHWTRDARGTVLAGKVPWDQLDPAIRDILVDFVYQGFTRGPNPMLMGMRNDYDQLIHYVQTNPTMRRYEASRKRARYLEEARKARRSETRDGPCSWYVV